MDDVTAIEACERAAGVMVAASEAAKQSTREAADAMIALVEEAARLEEKNG